MNTNKLLLLVVVMFFLQHRMSNDSVRSEKIANNTRLTTLYPIE